MNRSDKPGWGPWRVQVLRGKRFQEGVDETNDYLRNLADGGREVEKREIVAGPDGNLSFVIWYREPLVLEEGAATEGAVVPNPPAVDIKMSFKAARERWLEHLEREYLSRVIKKHGRDSAVIADVSGLDRAYIFRLMRNHGL